ncbi:MAG: type II secretion system F family protein [Candidatus Omnitrophota bacterium]
MPIFLYTARDRAGKKISGAEDAGSADELTSRLQAKNLIIINITPQARQFKQAARTEVTISEKKGKHWGVRESDLVLYCRQLATLLGAGVTILKSLEIIQKQVASRKLYNMIRVMIRDMEAGLSLHEAMAKHPKIFSELWINLVESGEASGNLAIVLTRLANYLERNADFKKKVISALIYPAILVVAGLSALLFLTVKILPTFVEIFKGFNMTLPALTQALVSISEFIRKYLFLMFAVSIGAGFLFRSYVRTGNGRRVFERFLFKLPVFGDFFHALAIERFSSEMATLIESGVPILFSLEIAERSVGNLIVADIVRQIKENVRDGKSLSQQLENSGFFDPMVVQMVAVGEEIGELSQMFKRVNAFYEDFVSTFLTRFTAMFEPAMLLFMGVVIGIMVVGMFLPILKLSQLGG